jgi:hypothetical protein
MIAFGPFIALAAAVAVGDALAITSVTPEHSPVDGGIEIVIRVAGLYPGASAYCRFDSTIVQGSVLPDSSLQCIAPKHAAGDVALAVSLDQAAWSADVPFRYGSSGKAVFVIVVVFLALSAVSFGFFIYQMRQCKQAQRKQHKMAAAFADSYVGYAEPDASTRRKPPIVHL